MPNRQSGIFIRYAVPDRGSNLRGIYRCDTLVASWDAINLAGSTTGYCINGRLLEFTLNRLQNPEKVLLMGEPGFIKLDGSPGIHAWNGHQFKSSTSVWNETPQIGTPHKRGTFSNILYRNLSVMPMKWDNLLKTETHPTLFPLP